MKGAKQVHNLNIDYVGVSVRIPRASGGQGTVSVIAGTSCFWCSRRFETVQCVMGFGLDFDVFSLLSS